MSRVIELTDELYGELERAAHEQGLTPSAWIASTLQNRDRVAGNGSLSELLQGLVGAVDIQRTRRHQTSFGNLLAGKFQRQGLRQP